MIVRSMILQHPASPEAAAVQHHVCCRPSLAQDAVIRYDWRLLLSLGGQGLDALHVLRCDRQPLAVYLNDGFKTLYLLLKGSHLPLQRMYVSSP